MCFAFCENTSFEVVQHEDCKLVVKSMSSKLVAISDLDGKLSTMPSDSLKESENLGILRLVTQNNAQKVNNNNNERSIS